jgi:outer membrane protein TolC
VSELASLRERKRAETHRELAEKARYDQVVQDLNGRREKARAQLDGARRVARLVPAQGDAARAAVEQSTARYRAGLATVVEVAEAQRLLAQAEIDDALAKLGVWRALLGVAAASGDLEPFLQQAGR